MQQAGLETHQMFLTERGAKIFQYDCPFPNLVALLIKMHNCCRKMINSWAVMYGKSCSPSPYLIALAIRPLGIISPGGWYQAISSCDLDSVLLPFWSTYFNTILEILDRKVIKTLSVLEALDFASSFTCVKVLIPNRKDHQGRIQWCLCHRNLAGKYGFMFLLLTSVLLCWVSIVKCHTASVFSRGL